MRRYRSIIVFVVIIIFILVSVIIMRGRRYNPSDYVSMDDDKEAEIDEDSQFYSGSFDENDVDYDDSSDTQDLDVDSEDTSESDVDSESTLESDVDSEVTQEPDVDNSETIEAEDDSQVASDSEPDPEFSIKDDDMFGWLLFNFICDRMSDGDEKYIDEDLMQNFDRTVEPYASLQGLDEIDTLTGIASSGTLTVKLIDGTIYRFKAEIEDEKIVSISQQ